MTSAGIDTATLNSPNYVKAGGILSDIDCFDAAFFDYSPKEAALMDPQHRLFLECAWEALESAGIEAGTDENTIGVYAGVGMNTYLLNNLYPNRQASNMADNYQLMIGNSGDFLTSRVSYKLNLKGASVNIQTACSTSLVAIHAACKRLLEDECNIALAGGVSIRVPQKTGYLYQEGMIMSPDGHCRAFDANAQGTVGGNGIGLVVLKRLEDAQADGDYIHAVIKGSATNNDGAVKVGYTAPSVEGQAKVISEAQTLAGVDPETINYIETHGTGTKLGDPIEIAALNKAFRTKTQKTGICAIGSVKTNIGHTDTAAGVTGLIKTSLALKHQALPPSLHFEQANPQIDFASSPFYVNTELAEWKRINGTPRRAGVSSFGIGGTNAHVILEEAPERELSGESRSSQLLVLSAKTDLAVETATANLAIYLEQHPDVNLADVAYTLSKGRKAFRYRRTVICHDVDEAITALRTPNLTLTSSFEQSEGKRPVVFMFSGQGTQYVNMGLELYQTEPKFKEIVDECAEYLQPLLGLDLRQVLYPGLESGPRFDKLNDRNPRFDKLNDRLSKEGTSADAQEQINQTAIAQPALFVVEYALAKLWMSWGVYPEAMIGHSIGEYVAACISGVLSLENALTLVATRGKLMQQVPPGTMLAVPLSAQKVEARLGEELSLAAINTLSLCVVSGSTAAVDTLQHQLTQEGIECTRLHTSHAFHSQMMEPILAAFTEQVEQVGRCTPQIPYLSNVTGTWMTAEESVTSEYWADHLRRTVRFSEGVQQLLQKPERIFLEIGPGKTLSSIAKRHPKAANQVVLSSLRHPKDSQSDVSFLLKTLGKLWLVGKQINWSEFYTNQRRYSLPLPTYPFERQRYWIESPCTHQQSKVIEPQISDISNLQLDTKSESIATVKRIPSVSGEKHSLKSETYVAPRNELEKTIANIWAKCLEIEQVGIHDNFFDLGGDSLQAVQLVYQLKNALQIQLGPQHIIEAPSVTMLASMIEQKRKSSYLETDSTLIEEQTNSILVELQAGNSSMLPLFCIHPAGGSIFPYISLACYLDSEQLVYGIQTPNFEGEQKYSGLADRARHYIQVIRTVQPTGPYFLAGMSYGGNMAVEMAIQLNQQGEKVALVAMFDSYPPISYQNQAEDQASFLVAFANAARELLGKEYEPQHIEYNKLQQLDEEQQWAYVIERMGLNGSLLNQKMSPDDLHHLFKIWLGHHKDLRHHLSQIYSGRLTFFQADETLPGDIDDILTMDVNAQTILKGWSQISSEPIEYLYAQGNHLTMLSEPHVQKLGKQLKSIIKKAHAEIVEK
ncbi:polyketide synthase [Beggiatoa sp. PS]|nr:polyketide synthase [Beggiatoa sp. PS]